MTTAVEETIDSKHWSVVAISSEEDRLRIKQLLQDREREQRVQERTKSHFSFYSKAPILLLLRAKYYCLENTFSLIKSVVEIKHS